jgi:hypothetical protein
VLSLSLSLILSCFMFTVLKRKPKSSRREIGLLIGYRTTTTPFEAFPYFSEVLLS